MKHLAVAALSLAGLACALACVSLFTPLTHTTILQTLVLVLPAEAAAYAFAHHCRP